VIVQKTYTRQANCALTHSDYGNYGLDYNSL